VKAHNADDMRKWFEW